MRTKRNRRAPRALQLAAGALTLAVPTTAVVLQATAAAAQGATPGPSLRAHVVRRSVAFGSRVVVRGSAPASDAGRAVQLQFERAGSTQWHPVARGTIGSRGHFTLRASLRHSGLVRAISPPPAGAADTAAGVSTSASAPAPSTPQAIGIRAGFQVAARSYAVAAGHSISVRGKLDPRQHGRVVRLMTHSAHGWVTLARTRTGRDGAFALRYTMRTTGTRWLRVSFAGDRANRGTWAHAGRVTGLVYRVASWYNDGGNTACGFHAYYGVANRTLPCGTKVTFEYGGHTVTATVDDRGPYVGGRDYDLNQNVAGALGMHGVAGVLASI